MIRALEILTDNEDPAAFYEEISNKAQSDTNDKASLENGQAYMARELELLSEFWVKALLKKFKNLHIIMLNLKLIELLFKRWRLWFII